MISFEALNALYGDCLLLRYPDGNGVEQIWIIDGGPRAERVAGEFVSVWKDVLVPRLQAISKIRPVPVALGLISHIDDDHINGLQRLLETCASATSGRPAPVRFERFWFNSFSRLVQSTSGENAAAELKALATEEGAEADAIVQSVSQGEGVTTLLNKLQLADNPPFHGLVQATKGQGTRDVTGASVTIVGPLAKRVEKLRTAWETAVKKKEDRTAARQDLFASKKELDTSIPNLSSIALLVEVGGRKLLLAADAQGADIVTAWEELGLGSAPVQLDVLKMPHHGSMRNTPEAFLEMFVADHYVFSANGKYRNPDPEVLEATVKIHGHRPVTLHFTNRDVTWDPPYALEKGGRTVGTLDEMIEALVLAYGGPWKAAFRAPNAKSVIVELP